MKSISKIAYHAKFQFQMKSWYSPFLLILALCLYSNSKLIDSKLETHFTLEVGSALQQKIPILFRNFQHSLVKELTKKADKQPQKLCQIRLSQNGILRIINSISYNFTGFTEQQIQDKIVYDLNQLRSLKIFVDAVYIQKKLIALFENNEVIIYSFNLDNGLISTDIIVKIDNVESLNDAKLTIFNKKCFIVSPKAIGSIQIDGQYNFYANLTASQSIMGEAVQIKNIFLAADGQKGLVRYSLNSETNSIDQIYRTTFQFRNNQIQANFSVDQLFYDQFSKQIYILDHKEGLIQTNQSDYFNNIHVIVTGKKLLMGGCYNLIVTIFHIYLTCPELIQINRDTFLITKLVTNSFFPYEVKYADERLYLFGRMQFAIFDIFGQLIEQHTLSTHSQKSFQIGNYLVTFTGTQVISSSIISQRELLYCYTDSLTMVGAYRGTYQSQGLCKEYYPSPLNTTQICFVEYPFTISLTNSAPLYYDVEIGLLIAWIVIMVAGVSYCTIKYFLIHKGYKMALVEQDTLDQVQTKKQKSEAETQLAN